MSMITIKGSHGTTASRVDNIRKSGWNYSRGRGGTGVYFWKECEHYIQLAEGWYKYVCATKKYNGDKDLSCKIIIARLEAEEAEVLDFDNHRELKIYVYEIAKKYKIDYSDKRKLSALYDLFITELEKKKTVKYKIVTLEVAPPPKEHCPWYPIVILGPPICCAVRDKNCITITDVI